MAGPANGDRGGAGEGLPPLPLSTVPKPASPEPKKPNKFEFYAKKLETFTSTIIPILFIVFNFIYCPWLIAKAGYHHHSPAPGTY